MSVRGLLFFSTVPKHKFYSFTFCAFFWTITIQYGPLCLSRIFFLAVLVIKYCLYNFISKLEQLIISALELQKSKIWPLCCKLVKLLAELTRLLQLFAFLQKIEWYPVRVNIFSKQIKISQVIFVLDFCIIRI